MSAMMRDRPVAPRYSQSREDFAALRGELPPPAPLASADGMPPNVHAEHVRLNAEPCGHWHPGNSGRQMNTLRCERVDGHEGCHEASEDGDLIRWWNPSRSARTCGICGRWLSDDPDSGPNLNCGGDCRACMDEAEGYLDEYGPDAQYEAALAEGEL